MVNFFSTKYMANDDFSEPPRRADSKNPIFFFCRVLGLGHPRCPGVSLVIGLGGGGGGASHGEPQPVCESEIQTPGHCVLNVCSLA